MKHPERYIVEHIIPALEELQRKAQEHAHTHRHEIGMIPARYQESALNLLHYLAIRQVDIRKLQNDLALFGLSRLGHAEAHILNSIAAMLNTLRILSGQGGNLLHGMPFVDIEAGDGLLCAHTTDLLGPPPAQHTSRIMVTMPGEAATDPQLLRDLLDAGMNVMRINCAHDDLPTWLTMIRHLREAERLVGKHCLVYADLAGPKLRTGAIEASGRLAEIKVKRDVWGTVIAPALLWLTPADAPEAPTRPVAATLPLAGELLLKVQAQDSIEFVDARGSLRQITIQQPDGRSWLAHCNRHSYLREGTPCHLSRNEQPLGQGTIGPLPEVVEPILLHQGDTLYLSGNDTLGKQAVYDAQGKLLTPARIPCTLAKIFAAAQAGQPIWFDDGKIGGEIVANDGQRIEIRITHAAPQGSKLRPGKGINLPLTELDIPALAASDIEHLRELAPHIDLVGLSFVRSAQDVLALHQQLRELHAERLGTVLKIETRQGFENLPQILLTGMRQHPVGVMVARGDLAVEIGFERMAEVQEEILWLCEAAHVPVIWATQVLDTMARQGMPSRAEVSDAAFSVRTECVMLNKGPYIIDTVRFLGGVLKRMNEHRLKQHHMLRALSVSHLKETKQID